jgi:hypothetical protein
MMSPREGLPHLTAPYPQASALSQPRPCLAAWGPDHPLIDRPAVEADRVPTGRAHPAPRFIQTAAREVADALIVIGVLGRFFALVAVMLIERRFAHLRRGHA